MNDRMGWALVAACLTLATPGRASAQDWLDYEAPSGCPDADAVAQEVVLRLGRDDPGGPILHARIGRDALDGVPMFVATLDVDRARRSTFVGTRCEEVVDRLATAMAQERALESRRTTSASPRVLEDPALLEEARHQTRASRTPAPSEGGPDWGWFAAGMTSFGVVYLASVSIGLGFLGSSDYREREAAAAFFVPVAGTSVGSAIAAGYGDEGSVAAGVAGTIVQTFAVVAAIVGLAVKAGGDTLEAELGDGVRLGIAPTGLHLTY